MSARGLGYAFGSVGQGLMQYAQQTQRLEYEREREANLERLRREEMAATKEYRDQTLKAQEQAAKMSHSLSIAGLTQEVYRGEQDQANTEAALQEELRANAAQEELARLEIAAKERIAAGKNATTLAAASATGSSGVAESIHRQGVFEKLREEGHPDYANLTDGEIALAAETFKVPDPTFSVEQQIDFYKDQAELLADQIKLEMDPTKKKVLQAQLSAVNQQRQALLDRLKPSPSLLSRPGTASAPAPYSAGPDQGAFSALQNTPRRTDR